MPPMTEIVSLLMHGPSSVRRDRPVAFPFRSEAGSRGFVGAGLRRRPRTREDEASDVQEVAGGVEPAKLARDPAAAERLWTVSTELCGM